MNELIFSLTDAINGSPAVALAAALAWGVLSVLLSPCHLGTIPLVVGFVGSGGATTRGRGAALAFSFAGGMLLAILVAGALAGLAGQALQGFGAATNYIIAAVFFAAALNLFGILPLPTAGLSLGKTQRKGLFAAALMGLVLGIGLSPCTFAFLAPILGATAGSAASDPLFSAALLLMFGVGHCGIIGGVGSSTELVQRYLNWTDGSRALTWAKWACGALLLLAGGVLLYTA
jgi:cytochrome c-type biogenesis protein